MNKKESAELQRFADYIDDFICNLALDVYFDFDMILERYLSSLEQPEFQSSVSERCVKCGEETDLKRITLIDDEWICDDCQQEEEQAPCKKCGSTKGFWFSKTEPMGFHCEDCGARDGQQEAKPKNVTVGYLPDGTVGDYQNISTAIHCEQEAKPEIYEYNCKGCGELRCDCICEPEVEPCPNCELLKKLIVNAGHSFRDNWCIDWTEILRITDEYDRKHKEECYE